MAIIEKNKARGMLVGLAVGDALGAPVEFLPEPSDIYIKDMGEEIEHFHENSRAPKGVWTDDTEMALCIADSLIVNNGYDSYDIMRRFCAWSEEGYRTYDGKPAVDVGGQTARAIDDFVSYPIVWKDTPKTESAGNGAIMRLAPILIANKDLSSAIKMAELSCRETHDSIAACAVTEMFAKCLFGARSGFSKKEIVSLCSEKLTNREYDEFRVENMDELVKRAKDSGSDKLCNLDGYIVDTFAISLWGLINFENFEDGMMAVIRLGGDTDTNGACYGQLAGAYYGFDKIPSEWRDEVYLSHELVEIADMLFGIKKCSILKTRFEDDEHFASE